MTPRVTPGARGLTVSPLSMQVACMQFINIVVHSVEDMNFRVHLQYEFTKLGLDDYLEVSPLSLLSAVLKCPRSSGTTSI